MSRTDYPRFDGGRRDPGQIAAITLDILDADDMPGHSSILARYPDLSFLGRIGLAAVVHDMQVAFASVDPVNVHLKIQDELTVTNPAEPKRGTVRITNDGVIRWRCRIRNEKRGADGLYSAQIASTIALVIRNTPLDSTEAPVQVRIGLYGCEVPGGMVARHWSWFR